jgi:hypothetical protein
MAPPGAAASTYRLYKEDIKYVATWLVSTAKSLGYPENSGRLKGKARAEAKKATARLQSSSQGTKHVIHIHDFIPLAEYIA